MGRQSLLAIFQFPFRCAGDWFDISQRPVRDAMHPVSSEEPAKRVIGRPYATARLFWEPDALFLFDPRVGQSPGEARDGKIPGRGAIDNRSDDARRQEGQR